MIGLAVATGALALAVALGADIASAVLIGVAAVLRPRPRRGDAERAHCRGRSGTELARVGLASGVLASGRYVGSIIASMLLGLLVADNGDGVTTMLAMSSVALIPSLGRPPTSPGAYRSAPQLRRWRTTPSGRS